MATSTFLELVEAGRLPKGKKLRGIVFWSRRDLDDFIDNYEGETEDAAAVDAKWRKVLGGNE
jgi:hypothetical protein